MNALLVAQTAFTSVPDPADVKPGWLALVIVLLMGLATFLLWRSMNHQLNKVDFDDGTDREGAGDRDGERDGGATTP
jgi:hypothetical protein